MARWRGAGTSGASPMDEPPAAVTNRRLVVPAGHGRPRRLVLLRVACAGPDDARRRRRSDRQRAADVGDRLRGGHAAPQRSPLINPPPVGQRRMPNGGFDVPVATLTPTPSV